MATSEMQKLKASMLNRILMIFLSCACDAPRKYTFSCVIARILPLILHISGSHLPRMILLAMLAGCGDSMTSHSKKFLALGDSYTIGESVDPQDRWPVQLAKMLRVKGIDIAEPQIIARTGWTTDDL